jgi:hypothetical protein
MQVSRRQREVARKVFRKKGKQVMTFQMHGKRNEER